MDGVGFTEYVTWLLNYEGLTLERRADLWEKRPTSSGRNQMANAVCAKFMKDLDNLTMSGRTAQENDGRWLPGMIAQMARKGMTKDEIIKDLLG